MNSRRFQPTENEPPTSLNPSADGLVAAATAPSKVARKPFVFNRATDRDFHDQWWPEGPCNTQHDTYPCSAACYAHCPAPFGAGRVSLGFVSVG